MESQRIVDPRHSDPAPVAPAMRRLAGSLLGLSFLALVAGCTVEERVSVRSPRPVDRVEIVTVRPSPAHVWIAGRWEARGTEWQWSTGRWERR